MAILAGVAMQSMTVILQDARTAKTVRELETLDRAIVGDPRLVSAGHRCDFGYVGDVGAFPPGLAALLQNPGGYATWSGPYIPAGFVQDSIGFRTDEWGQAYVYDGGLLLTSVGSGSTISRRITGEADDYLHNTLHGRVTDAVGTPPGTTLRDSVRLSLLVPDGLGSSKTESTNPDPSGAFAFDSLPVGTHRLTAVFVPRADTLQRYVSILPRHKDTLELKFAANCFHSSGGGSLSLLPGSVVPGAKGNCERVYFTIQNATGSNIEISWIKLTYSAPVAYYQTVKWDGDNVWNQSNPKLGSGESATFASAKTIADGSQVEIQVRNFRDNRSGGSKVDMDNATVTVTFSDGSGFDIETGDCIE